jgi:hypothetical protein
MAAGADAAGGGYGPPPRPPELAEALARVHGLLDLAPTADSALLASLVEATVDRFNAMWAARDGLDRFLR